MPEPIVHVSDTAVLVEWPRGPMYRLTHDGQVTEQHTLSALDEGYSSNQVVELQYPTDDEEEDDL